jgi:hypothetical protein
MINLAQAARIEAMRLARNQVRQSIREEGRRLKDYEAKEIDCLARSWFAEHRQPMFDQALGNILRAQLTTYRQKSNGRPVRVSVVQISGAK